MKHIFFLIIAVSLSLVSVQSVYATHYSDFGINDVFTFREHDVDPIDSVFCSYNGVMVSPFPDDRINLECKHRTYDSLDRFGAIHVMKVFDKADIHNGTTTTFTWRAGNTCTETTCGYYGAVVMDGAYDYTKTSVPGGFESDVDYDMGSTNSCALTAGAWRDGGQYYCFQNGAGGANLDNIFGGGNLNVLGTTSIFVDNARNTKGDYSFSMSIDNTDWGESTESQITVFLTLFSLDQVKTNHFMQPLELSITNTDAGTMSFNFPETIGEVALWESYTPNHEYQLNGTQTDYGYFVSFDPTVPDPPTNLYALEGSTEIELFWTAPNFDGYDPLIGYRIERESPVGGGFSTIVSNTGTTLTEYTDTSITQGDEYNYRVRALNSLGESLPSNESKDGTSPSGDDLIISCEGSLNNFTMFVPVIGITTAGLCWNGGILNQTSLLGYQINYTTPWGDPITIVAGMNDTGNNVTTATLSPLEKNTQYSVRVQSWMNGSMNNVTNIANFTTRGDGLEIGNLIIPSESNPLRFDWIFTRDDLNADDVSIAVEYPDSYNATCTMSMKLSRTNLVYSNLVTTPHVLLSDRQIANFTFTDYNNEIITMTCVDEDTNSTGKYIVYQNDFPMKQQIASFKDGTYGTMGVFGFFDFFTLGAMFFAMIGFNRVHPGVGAVFAMMILGVASYLGFVEDIFTTATIGIIMTVVILAVLVQHRNDIIS